MVGLGFAAGAGETVLLVLALIGCIVAHEFGHYITAKAAGIKVTEFFVGFGPRLWSVRRGETEYGVKALPLGGYCRILGMNNLEEVDPADEARTYRQAPLWRRLSVALAGLGDALPHRGRGALRHVLLDRATTATTWHVPVGPPGLEPDRRDRRPHAPGPARPSWPASTSATGSSPSTAGTSPTGPQLSGYIQAQPGRRLDVTVDRRRQAAAPLPGPRQPQRRAAGGARRRAPPGGAERAPRRSGFIGIAPSPVIHSSLGESISRAGGRVGARLGPDARRLRPPVHPARRQLVPAHALQPEGGRQPRPAASASSRRSGSSACCTRPARAAWPRCCG